jgi:hypothetical protein
MVMGAKYDQKWTSRFTDDLTLKVAHEEWGVELYKIGGPLIRQGLERCTDVYPSWPPTVGEFKLLCKADPADYDLPTAEQAWSEICRESGQFSNGIIPAVMKDDEYQSFTWRNAVGDKGLNAFSTLYQRYVNKAATGVAFPLPEMIKQSEKSKKAARDQHRAYADIHMHALKSVLAR